MILSHNKVHQRAPQIQKIEDSKRNERMISSQVVLILNLSYKNQSFLHTEYTYII